MSVDKPASGLDAIAGARSMGSAIRCLRAKAELTQKDLARRIGMGHRYIGLLERGDIWSPGLMTVDRVANGLGVSTGLLAERFVRSAAAPWPGYDRPECGDHGDDGAQELGRALRLLRRSANRSRENVARAAGLGGGHLASIETGAIRNVRLGTVTRIASAFGPRYGELSLLVGQLACIFAGELTVNQLRDRVPAAPGLSDALLPVRGSGARSPRDGESGAHAAACVRPISSASRPCVFPRG